MSVQREQISSTEFLKLFKVTVSLTHHRRLINFTITIDIQDLLDTEIFSIAISESKNSLTQSLYKIL